MDRETRTQSEGVREKYYQVIVLSIEIKRE